MIWFCRLLCSHIFVFQTSEQVPKTGHSFLKYILCQFLFLTFFCCVLLNKISENGIESIRITIVYAQSVYIWKSAITTKYDCNLLRFYLFWFCHFSYSPYLLLSYIKTIAKKRSFVLKKMLWQVLSHLFFDPYYQVNIIRKRNCEWPKNDR